MYHLKLNCSFCAAHQLTNAYSSECNLFKHGHNFKTIIEIKTQNLTNGMVIDFKQLKEIIYKLDHKDLNTILDFEPTAENLSCYFYQQIKELLKEKHPNVNYNIKVTIFENDNASITYDESD